MPLSGKVILNEQETTGDYDFSIAEKYMTTRFQNTFGSEAVPIAFTAVSLIMERYPHEADYLQTFQYVYPDGKTTDFWIIHEHDCYTVLLPEEYCNAALYSRRKKHFIFDSINTITALSFR